MPDLSAPLPIRGCHRFFHQGKTKKTIDGR